MDDVAAAAAAARPTADPLAGTARAAFGALRPRVEELFDRLWEAAEPPAMEFRSAALLADWLGEEGFSVERGAGGVPTAFVARAACGAPGGPRIGLLLEYDALPGLANAAVAARRGGRGKREGHACGHNHIGPANAAAAVAAARVARALGLAGEIVAFGCPAEEIVWGKIALLRRGVFDGCDALLTSHGDYQTGALSRPCQSVVSGEFVFLGRAGHGGMAAAANALDAAELAVQSVHRLRASRFADAPVRHVLRVAGQMPGVTPEEARVWFTARAATLERAREAYATVRAACAQAADLAGCGLRHQFVAETRGYLPNDVLAEVLFDALREVGPPRWSPPDLAFMAELSAAAAPEGGAGSMTLDRGVALFREGADYYGQDDGEASWRVPLGRVNWAYPLEVPIHHWAWTALSGHPASRPGPLMAGEVLALGALRLLERPALLGEARRELEGRVRAAAAAGRPLDAPRLGAWRTLTEDPESFWDATWTETSEEFP